MKARASFYSSSVSVMTSSLETVRWWNTTFPVSVLMKYISFSNSFLSKLMEPFIIITNTFLYFLWHILFRRSLCCYIQHRPAFHIRSVQMSTERKMCCMDFLLVTICTAPFLCGMAILYHRKRGLSNAKNPLQIIEKSYTRCPWKADVYMLYLLNK